MRHVVLTPVENGWLAEVPSLPGCLTEADTKEEALEYIKEAIEAYILTLQDMGEPIPDDLVEFATV
jgi:predicted RNase H-like HicB family nuclease